MKRHLPSVLLLASAALGQYTGEPPTVVKPYAAYPALDVSVIGNNTTNIYTCRLVASPLLPANTYYACLTVGSSNPVKGYLLMSGTFNTVTGVFTKNTDFDGLNALFGSAEVFAPSVTRDLLTATFDSPQGVRWAVRANTSSPFSLMVPPVVGVPRGYIDPALGIVDGKDVMFFTTLATIQFGDYAGGAVTNIRTVQTVTGLWIHSPMPIQDAAGTTRALTYIQTAGNAPPFKLMFASSLIEDPGAPPTEYFSDSNNSNWPQNGSATGGTTTVLSSQNAFLAPYQIGFAGLNSSLIPALTVAMVNITSFAPQQLPAATPYVGVTSAGLLAPAGVAIGGIVVGNYSLNGITLLPVGAFDKTTGTFEQNYPLPAFPAGVKIHMQSLVADLKANKIYLSNTGKLEWK